MRRRQTEPISDAIRLFMREEGIETPYNQYRIVQAWPQVMGEAVARYTGNIFVKGQTLHVQITSPALKNNLMMSHKALAQQLNESIGAQVITDVNFY